MVLTLYLRATARVHLVHTMNMERRQVAADPHTRPNDPAVSLPVGCQKPHPSSLFITITQLKSWYSFYHPTDGRWRLSWPRHCSKVCSPCPRLYIVVVFTKNLQLPTVGFEPWSSHTAVRQVTARQLWPRTFLKYFWMFTVFAVTNIISQYHNDINTALLWAPAQLVSHTIAQKQQTYVLSIQHAKYMCTQKNIRQKNTYN